jgi:hypothetical protein
MKDLLYHILKKHLPAPIGDSIVEAEVEAEVEADVQTKVEAEVEAEVESEFYSAEAVKAMSDAELVERYREVTGKMYLTCTHCHYARVELDRFVGVIRERCLRKNRGLHKMLVVPKTCDHQTAANRARNEYYARLKHATSAEEIAILKIEYAGVFLGDRRKHRLRI